jgi:hypothetical protein
MDKHFSAPSAMDQALYKIMDELCQHDEILRDSLLAQAAIVATLKEFPDLHAAYKRHYEAKAMNGSLESFDLHMKEMQQLRERLRQIVGDTDSHPL